MTKKLFAILFPILFSSLSLFGQQASPQFRVRTITAGISLKSLADTETIRSAIEFLKLAKQAYNDKGYEVQTLRISTQNFYKYIDQHSYNDALAYLIEFDRIALRNNILLSIGQVLPPDKYQSGIGDWAEKLLQST